jgi:hypothetical protein
VVDGVVCQVVDGVVCQVVDGVIEVMPTDAGPAALMEKLPLSTFLYVVTTKTYVRPDCKLLLILNCPLPLPLSSSDVIKL